MVQVAKNQLTLKEVCSSDSECSSNYCTPSSLGERHCCNTGQKWDSDFKKCTGTSDCDTEAGTKKIEKRVINTLKRIFTKKPKTMVELFTFAEQEIGYPCDSGYICCQVDLGEPDRYQCVERDKCIKSY